MSSGILPENRLNEFTCILDKYYKFNDKLMFWARYDIIMNMIDFEFDFNYNLSNALNGPQNGHFKFT